MHKERKLEEVLNLTIQDNVKKLVIFKIHLYRLEICLNTSRIIH